LINLVLPDSNQNLYYTWRGLTFGPFSPDFIDHSQSIGLTCKYDTLTQGGMRFHENDVDHTKMEGSLTSNPAMNSIAFPNTANASNMITLQYLDGSIFRDYSQFGLWREGSLGSYDLAYYDYSKGDQYDYVLYDVKQTGVPSLTSSLVARRYHAYKPKKVGNSVVFLEDVSEYQVYWGKYISSWNELTLSKLEEVLATLRPTSAGVGASRTRSLGTLLKSAICSISSVRDYIDYVAYPAMSGVNPTLVEVDYGTLAHEASEKFNANTVNMIAFLKDLRHPTEMIPKMRNFRILFDRFRGLSRRSRLKLKESAGDYLSVIYGALPTISDLQGIVSAMKKNSPYVDRNGYSLYTAGNSSSAVDANYSYQLEQHIKLAIENEDSDYIELLNSMESSGFAPTLQNLWDLVPYSFAIDWFINVGDFLERVDSNLRILRLNIRYVTMSRKRITSMVVKPSSSLPLMGTLKLVHYSRWTTDRCPVPPLFSQNTNADFHHWLEAGALITQRTKY
jgi:hypothetical protein